MSEYLQVAEDVDSEPVELQTEDDGTVMLSTIREHYPGATGLKYRNPETNVLRIIRPTERQLHPLPGNSRWGSQVYLCVYRKDIIYHYLQVAEDEIDEPMELPTEDDGTVLLSTSVRNHKHLSTIIQSKISNLQAMDDEQLGELKF